MNQKKQKIHIIGAGVSGLIAATVLENNGYHPIILESTNQNRRKGKNRLYLKYKFGSWFSGTFNCLSICSKIS